MYLLPAGLRHFPDPLFVEITIDYLQLLQSGSLHHSLPCCRRNQANINSW